VYDYPAVAGSGSLHHMPNPQMREEKPPSLVWKEYAGPRRGAFDALWRTCVAALAYLLALFGRRAVQDDDDHLGSASINSHHEETPAEWLRHEPAEWIRVPTSPLDVAHSR
jgi:hypothetical protein